METYEGVKFRTVFVDRRPPVSASAEALVAWSRAFVSFGFSSAGEEASGNLSCRLDQGFLITPTHVPFPTLQPDDLVHVLEATEPSGPVLVRGTREPSSETPMHAAIYAARPDVAAIFHGHSPEILRQGASLGMASTPEEVPYGSPRLASQAAACAREHELFILLNHGFVTLGRTMDEAGETAREALQRVRAARLG